MARNLLRYDNETRQILNNLGLTGRGGSALRFDGEHADAGESAFLLQQLQAIEQKVFETPNGPMKAEQLIPMDMSIPAGAQEWGYDRVTSTGLAEWIAADAGDIPQAEVEKERVTFPVKSMALGYHYTLEDLMAAMMSGMPLESAKATACRRGIDMFRDKVLLEGDSSVGMSGFMNDSTVSVTSATYGEWDGTDATPDEIIADINAKVFQVLATCKEVYAPDTLVVPMAVYSHLTTTPRSSTSDTTIWEFIKANNPYLKNLVPLLQLGLTSDPGGLAPGANNVGRAILYKKDPEVLTAKVAIPFDQRPPQMRGLSVEVPCWARIGGCHFRVPIAALYIDGVR